ncbi:g724 [Coccomyxa viridis]|uniref:G724 protein n=1 Tax=Coccomyxa viridis TaxID=1274662 RepID=A0ABP1FK48_9CHLO
MNSPRPRIIVKEVLGSGRAEQAQRAKPCGEMQRVRPLRACRQGSAVTATATEAPVVQSDPIASGPRSKNHKAAEPKEPEAAIDVGTLLSKVLKAAEPKEPEAAINVGIQLSKDATEVPLLPSANAGAAKPKAKKRPRKATGKEQVEGCEAAVLAEAAPAPKAKKQKVVKEAKPEGQEAKVSKPKKVKVGSDLVETPLPTADFQAAAGALQEVKLDTEYTYAPGKEPYRKLGLKVYEQPQASVEECKLVLSTQDQYWRYYQEAKRTENARYDSAGGRHPNGKKLSKRPDIKARTRMEVEGKNCNAEKRAGYVRGHQPNQRYFARSEIGTLGLHFLPVGGIQTATKQDLPKGCPMFALSVVSSGCYEDDADEGEVMTLTGEGGNNLLGDKRQNGHQELKAGNLALVGNIQLGIPVRMIRKNKAKGAELGYIYIFDGLYNVVKYYQKKGLSGFLVYKYVLKRRPDQGQLCSKALVFGGGCAPKNFTAESRRKEVRYLFSEDISSGKEPIPVVGVNEWNEDVLSIANCDDSAQNLPLVHDKYDCPKLQRYVTEDERLPGIPEPKALEVPEEFKGNPHKFIAQLNSGALPYQLAGDGKTGILARMPMAMVYECGPWTGCKDGKKCLQAVTQRGCPWRLELFMTKGMGWGVRSWDTIPFGAFVTSFRCLIRPHSAREHEEDDTFVFNLDKRSDMSWDNKDLDEPEQDREIRYVLDSTRIGNVGRYINHSCNPNCFVQPVLSTHGDKEMPGICFFATRNIPPMEELAYDYGAGYIETRLGGRCHCGDAICTFAGTPASSP